MRKVLIPTDFSIVSKNAIFYSLNLYKDTDTIFTIIHIYQPSFDPNQHEIVDSSLGMNEVKKENMQNLVSSISQMAKDFNIKLESSIEIGFTVETIVRASVNYNIIIMGSTGSNSILNKVFGGISTGVVSKSVCPVLLIPGDILFNGIKNILYAYNLKEIGSEILNSVIDFAKRLNSKIHFVQIQNDIESQSLELPILENVTYTTNSLKYNSFKKGLNSYINDNRIDILIITTKHRNFWNKIFHKSFTKELALNTSIPLLVYHKN